MREFIDGYRIANAIRQSRSQNPETCWIIVEGPTDVRFFKRMMDSEACDFEHAGETGNAKAEAIKALEILNNQPVEGVLAIVDADFMRLDQQEPPFPNLFLTDGHDLEGMLIQSPALEKLLDEYASSEKIRNFVKKHGSIREALLKACRPLGLIRWYNHVHSGSLRFSKLEYKKFIGSNSLEPDETELVRLVLARSRATHLEDELRSYLSAEHKGSHWDVCQGHDLLGVLTLALGSALGSKNKGRVDAEFLGRNLRLAYEAAWFQKTNLYSFLKNWNDSQSDYHLFEVHT